MEIFIATSIKSFDLNPTHPGPLSRVSFHTSATQQIERSARAARPTKQVTSCKSPRAANKMISSSRLAATPRQLGSSALRKAKSVSTAKVLRERIKRNDDERLPRVLDCRKWKLRQPETTTGPRKTRARRRKRARDHPRTRDRCGREGLTQKARKFSARNICPILDSRSKTDLETQRKLSEHVPTQRKARAREEPSPGPPASKTDARPPGHQPRGGAPARPRFSRGQEGST